MVSFRFNAFFFPFNIYKKVATKTDRKSRSGVYCHTGMMFWRKKKQTSPQNNGV